MSNEQQAHGHTDEAIATVGPSLLCLILGELEVLASIGMQYARLGDG